MGRYFKAVLPVIIIIAGVLVAWQLLVNSPKAQRKPVVAQLPLVRTLQVQPQTVRIPVYSQGAVMPGTSINLSAEVTGRIIETSPLFASGSFFKRGDVLLRINPSDYELAITKAEALVAGAMQQLARAEAEYQQKLKEYKGIDPARVTDYALRKPQYEEAKARLKAATADLDLAKVQLARCDIRAPFDGRIVEKKADLGQYVTPGMMLANVYATDVAEVRLPLSQAQMNLLDLPFTGRHGLNNHEFNNKVPVTLTAQTVGRKSQWQSWIVRTEATIDERNRLQYVVVQVKDPYGFKRKGFQGKGSNQQTALTSGLFVEAEIEGRLIKDVYVLPRIAIHNSNKVWLLDNEKRLRIGNVELMHRGENKVYIKAGLNPNDMVIVSPLDAVVDGMQLRTQSAP
jgi:RND family efflux transporter MFP subunit